MQDVLANILHLLVFRSGHRKASLSELGGVVWVETRQAQMLVFEDLYDITKNPRPNYRFQNDSVRVHVVGIPRTLMDNWSS